MHQSGLVLLSAALLVAVAAAGDEPQIKSVPRTIDVVVTDNRGAHLAGLTQSDFQILEYGQSREIARFPALAPGPEGVDAQPGRHVVLVIEETTCSLS